MFVLFKSIGGFHLKRKHICLLSLFLTLFIITSCSTLAPQKGDPAIRKGDFAPDLLGETLDGHEVHLSEFRGKVVVLIFWKTWCNACRIELVNAKVLRHAYKNKFLLFAINIGEPTRVVRTFKMHYLLDFPVLVDPRTRVFSEYGIRVWPTTILINQRGQVCWTGIGSEVELLRQEIEILLEERTA